MTRQELSRRDDLWSFFFMLLEKLGQQLPWRSDDKLSLVSAQKLCRKKCAQ
jgi:hypothetical protein